jgi:hypothetical protein
MTVPQPILARPLALDAAGLGADRSSVDAVAVDRVVEAA